MPNKYTYSKRAQNDLIKIYKDTVKTWGVDQAQKYETEIGRVVQLLAGNPDMGRDCEWCSVRVYPQDNSWSQQAYLKASNTGLGDSFGHSVSLNTDGVILAVGALNESSAATGVNGDQADNNATGSGAVYVFIRNGNNWSQEAYLKSSNTDASDFFGVSVGLSADRDTLAVGAFGEAGATGSVYLY